MRSLWKTKTVCEKGSKGVRCNSTLSIKKRGERRENQLPSIEFPRYNWCALWRSYKRWSHSRLNYRWLNINACISKGCMMFKRCGLERRETWHQCTRLTRQGLTSLRRSSSPTWKERVATRTGAHPRLTQEKTQLHFIVRITFSNLYFAPNGANIEKII